MTTSIRVKLTATTLALACMVPATAQTWTQVGPNIDGNSTDDLSGFSVSLSADGHRVAIGAPTFGVAADSGSVRVFEEVGGSWVQVGMPMGGQTLNDQAGYSISLSADGSRLAIGAPKDIMFFEPGYVRVYAESGGVWTQVGADLVGEAIDDRSGCSVSLSSDGTRVAIGAKWNDGITMDAGHVRIYSETGGSWSQVGSDIDGEAGSDHFGESVSLSADGSRVAVGAPRNSGSATYAGHVQVYGETGGVWSQIGSDIDGEAAQDFSGVVSLSANGGRVAIGAPGNDDNGMFSGHVRVFAESGGAWAQVGADIPGEAAWDESGASVSLSADGTVIAIGATPNNDNAGHVRVFSENGGTWTQLGADIDGDAIGINSGFSVSLSHGGDRVAIGAPFGGDGTMQSAGQVGVYEFVEPMVVPASTYRSSFTVSPMPATDVIRIDVPQRASLSVIDLLGKAVLSVSLAAGHHRIDVSGLARGAYMAELRPVDGSPSRAARVILN